MHYTLVSYKTNSASCRDYLYFKSISALISNYDKLKARGFELEVFKNKKQINLDDEVKKTVENELIRNRHRNMSPIAMADLLNKPTIGDRISGKLNGLKNKLMKATGRKDDDVVLEYTDMTTAPAEDCTNMNTGPVEEFIDVTTEEQTPLSTPTAL